MSQNYKPREDHKGPPTTHLGQGHYEKSQLEKQAAEVESRGPSDTVARESIEDHKGPIANEHPADIADPASDLDDSDKPD